MHQQVKGFLWLAATIACGAGLAVGLPYFASWVPWSVEKKAALVIASPHVDCSPDASALLEKITQRLYPLEPDDANFSLTVHLVKNPQINAVTGLGGDVQIYSALLKDAPSPEALAAVIAHEIEHVHHRHVMQALFVNLSTVGALHFLFSDGAGMGPTLSRLLLTMRFSRQQEEEADEGALKRLNDAHINVQGFIDFFNQQGLNASSISFLSDHPAPADRIARAQRRLGGKTSPLLTAEEWQTLKETCQ